MADQHRADGAFGADHAANSHLYASGGSNALHAHTTSSGTGQGTGSSSPAVAASAYSFPGVMHFLQSQWRIFERERVAWELERSDYLARIRFLESERRAVHVLRGDMLRRIRMLENALVTQRNGDSTSVSTTEQPPTTVDNASTTTTTTTTNVSNTAAVATPATYPGKNTVSQSREILRAYLHELSTILPASGQPNIAQLLQQQQQIQQQLQMHQMQQHPTPQQNERSLSEISTSIPDLSISAATTSAPLSSGPASAGLGSSNNGHQSLAASQGFTKQLQHRRSMSLMDGNNKPHSSPSTTLSASQPKDEVEEEDTGTITSGHSSISKSYHRASKSSESTESKSLGRSSTGSSVTSSMSNVSEASTNFTIIPRPQPNQVSPRPTNGNKSIGPSSLSGPTITMDVEDEEDDVDNDEEGANSDIKSKAAKKSKRLASGLTGGGIVSEDDNKIWKPKMTIRNHMAAIRAASFLLHPINSEATFAKSGPMGSVDMDLEGLSSPTYSRDLNVALKHPESQPAISLITGSDDFTVKLWDVTSVYIPLANNKTKAPLYKIPSDPEPIQVLRGHTGAITRIDWLCGVRPDGKKTSELEEHIYTASIDGTIKVWRFAKGKRVHKLKPGKEMWNTFDCFDLSYEEMQALEVHTYDGHSDAVWDIQVRSGGGPDKSPLLFSIGSDNTFRVWNASTKDRSMRKKVDLPKSRGVPTCFALLKDLYPTDAHYATLVAIGFEDGSIGILDYNNGIIVSDLERTTGSESAGAVRVLTIHRDGQVLISANDDLYLRMWDPKTGKSVGTPVLAHQSPVRSMHASSSAIIEKEAQSDPSIKGSICTASCDGSVRWWTLSIADGTHKLSCTQDYAAHVRVGGEGVISFAVSCIRGDRIDGPQTRRSFVKDDNVPQHFNRLNVLATAGADGQVKVFRIGGVKP